MSERILTGNAEEAAAQLWAHIEEKTMVNGEKLAEKFKTPADATEYYAPKLPRDELEKLNITLVETLQKMRVEREAIFEKDSALEEACGMLMHEKTYLQQQLAKAISVFSEHQAKMEERFKLIEQRDRARASDQTDPERHQSTERTQDVSPR